MVRSPNALEDDGEKLGISRQVVANRLRRGHYTLVGHLDLATNR